MTNDVALTYNNAEVGKALVTAAQQRHEEERREAVIREVRRLIDAREEWAEKERFAARAVEWYRAKLAAIEAGGFEFTTSPGLTGAGSMIFKESDFNRANF